MQTDIFEIKTASIEFKIGNKKFKVKDPKFLDKVNIKKTWESLEKEKDQLSETEYLEKAYNVNKLTLKAYMPEITDDIIAELISETEQTPLQKFEDKIFKYTESIFALANTKKNQIDAAFKNENYGSAKDILN